MNTGSTFNKRRNTREVPVGGSGPDQAGYPGLSDAEMFVCYGGGDKELLTRRLIRCHQM
jgi:hypothetical protein